MVYDRRYIRSRLVSPQCRYMTEPVSVNPVVMATSILDHLDWYYQNIQNCSSYIDITVKLRIQVYVHNEYTYTFITYTRIRYVDTGWQRPYVAVTVSSSRVFSHLLYCLIWNGNVIIEQRYMNHVDILAMEVGQNWLC